MADIKISQMTAGTPDENTLFEGALDGGGGVYSTRSVSASALATLLNTTIQYGGLTTSDDTIVGAINEIAQGGGGASVIQLTMSQYTALPSADKMNGSIYKITDKALIYCLDEEYHAVKEITSADYALLTSDEKNNGTLYIITDEETTANDIPYVQGVSVADKLATIQTITVKDYRVTLGTTLWNGVYWGEQNITSDVSAYGNPISATISELLDTSSTRLNRPTFAQLMTQGVNQFIVRAYSPQAGNAGGFDAVIRVVYANVSILT